jgi:hypothetical protein
MAYRCPKCERYGMEWDARAKVLTCYYNTCRHVIRMGAQKSIPSSEKISAAIVEDFQALHNKALDKPVCI